MLSPETPQSQGTFLSCGYDIGMRHSMDSLMFLQIPCLAKLPITLCTAEWFFFCVDSFMGL